MFAQPSWYIVALPCISETNEKKRERDKIVDVPVERERGEMVFCKGSWWKILAETRIGLRAGPGTDLV